MDSSLISHPCMVCCQPTTMWCSRCQATWYCSAEHLSSDWPRHKKECIPASATQAQNYSSMISTPPLYQQPRITVAALLFQPEEERARVVHVNCEPHPHGLCPLPVVHNYFPEGRYDSLVLTQGLNNETLRFPLHLWFDPNSLARNAPVNRAIFRITSGAAAKPWCGPVLVMKFNGSRRQAYTDASSNDLPALSSYFLSYK